MAGKAFGSARNLRIATDAAASAVPHSPEPICAVVATIAATAGTASYGANARALVEKKYTAFSGFVSRVGARRRAR